MKHRTVTATEFKAKCLALLDEVDQQGGTITVTKRGRPVAELKPSPRTAWKNPANSWAGIVEIVDDIVTMTPLQVATGLRPVAFSLGRLNWSSDHFAILGS